METPDDSLGGVKEKTLEDEYGSNGPTGVQTRREDGGSVDGKLSVSGHGRSGGGGADDEAQMKGVDHEKRTEVPIGDASVAEDGKVNGIEKGADSAEKIDVSGDGISLVVEVHGSSNGNVQGSTAVQVVEVAHKENGISRSEVTKENKGGQNSVFKELDNSLLEPTVNVGDSVEDIQVEGEKCQKNEFSVGDLVWGKVKGRPWWPGKIYNPSEASKNAARHHRRDCLLVAFFGDDTYAWCYPSQLKSFLEKFEEMSVQGTSPSFLEAVEEAVQEIGRRVESEWACSCGALRGQTSIVQQLSLNIGIKGVASSAGGIGKFSITLFESAKFLESLRNIAQIVPKISMLELAIFRSQISAFNRAMGYNQLAVFPESEKITDPEDNAGNGTKNEVAFGELTADLNECAPEADWSSSPLSPRFRKISARNCARISENKLHPRKKQRSMSDLLTTTSKKRKKVKDFQVGIDGGLAEDDVEDHKLMYIQKQKKGKLSGPLPVEADLPDDKDFNVKNDDTWLERSKTGSLTRERKKSKYLSPPYTTLGRGNKNLFHLKDSEAEYLKVHKVSDAGEDISGTSGSSPSIIKCTSETYQEKLPKESARKHKSYGTSSPPTPKEIQEKIDLNEGTVTMEEMLFEFQLTALDTMYLKGKNCSETVRNFFTKFRSSMYQDVSGDETFNKNLSACQASRKKLSMDFKHWSPKKGKHDGNDWPTSEVKSERKKRKRKEEAMLQSTESRLIDDVGTANVKASHNGGQNIVKDVLEPNQPTPDDRCKPKRRRRKSKSEFTGGNGFMKENQNEKLSGETLSAALFLTFAQGATLPSKDYLTKVFGKYGALNGLKTEVTKDSSRVSLVYRRSCDAELALKSSRKRSPLGPAVVSYQLQYLSTSSRDSEHDDNPVQILPPHKSLEEGTTLGYQSVPAPATEAPPLLFIKENLKMMTSMLEKSGNDLSPEVKANLEAEINSLLKKVTTIVGDHNGRGSS